MPLACRAFPLNMACEFDFTIARNTKIEGTTVLIEVTYTDPKGLTTVGYGEGVPAEFYGSTQANTLACFTKWQNEASWKVLNPFDIQTFHSLVERTAILNKPAQVAFEMALYDIQGKLCNQPVYRLLGLNPDRAPKSSYTIGIANIDMVKHKTTIALERGYDIIKVKLGSPHDVETLKLVRSLVPTTTRIRVDANAAWSGSEAMDLVNAIKPFNIEFVEEPYRADVSLEERIALKAQSVLPLMADESIHHLSDIPIVAQWGHAVNLKLTKTGGMMPTLAQIHAARALSLKIMLGCFVESSLSVTGMAHLAPLVDYCDLDGALLTANDPVQGIQWHGSQFTLPNRPGLGVIVPAELLKESVPS